jgi:hypothetical protein
LQIPGTPTAPAILPGPVAWTAADSRAPEAPEPSSPPVPERLTPIPQPPSPSEDSLPLRQLCRLAEQRYAAVNGYIVRLRRRERIGGKNQPEETILLKFRREPWSVYLRWLGKGDGPRELVYVKGQHEGVIHTLTAAADGGTAGRHVKTAADDPLVPARSRYAITDTGVGPLIERFARLVEAADGLKYLGPVARPEFDAPVEAVQQLIPPGAEPDLPKGGQRFWFFDTASRFPVLVVAQDEVGGEVEYYCYDNFLFPGRCCDDEFDPERLWGK